MRDMAGRSRNAEYAEPQQTTAANETNRMKPVIHGLSGKPAETHGKSEQHGLFSILPYRADV